MKRISIYKPQEIVVENADKPQVKDGYAVIKMLYCGICGSDITAFTGKNPTCKYPIIGLGHEGVGIVEEVGKNEYGIKVGDRVCLEPYVPCHKCHMDKVGRYNNCTDIRVCGVHKEGMMEEFFLHPCDQIYKIPDDLDFERAALVEPLSIGLHGATRARVAKGEKVVVFGAGTIGLMASFACMSKGATPILVDIVQSRLDFAKKQLKFPYVFNSKTDGDLVEFLKKVTDGKLPEAMIDCTGSPFIIGQMHDYVCHGGRIALIGWPHENVSVNQIRLMQKEIDVCPSRNSSNQFPTAIKIIQEDVLPVKKLITKVISMDEFKDTLVDIMNNPGNYLKVVLKLS